MMTRMSASKNSFFIIILAVLLTACHGKAWNNPYPADEEKANIYYASFSEQPKTLDPARAYSSDEALFINQIYEPPLQYHYLKRPYTLIPLTATAVPQPIYLNAQGKVLSNVDINDIKNIAYTIYKIQIKPHIYFQPHPAFARKPNGEYYYHHLTAEDVEDKYQLSDFAHTGTRELIAADYIYEIKRLLSPRVQSPVYGVMSKYIVNAAVLDKYTYTIKIKGYYPQFIYWLAMSFFAPMPWEADTFYSQPGMKDNNITLDWYPIGTGPYVLIENNPNRCMVLQRNPNFHGETYPTEGEPSDRSKGLLINAGKPLPFIDKFVFTLEKESIPRWNKFLQGYYDQSAISSDSFDQAIHLGANGQPDVAPLLKEKGIRLQTSIAPSIFYFGFNQLDPIVGGNSERARKLRQAIAVVLDYDEFIAIFLNGRGVAAQGPLPPDIFGYKGGVAGINPQVYQWSGNRAARLSLESAKRLLVAAGYPDGRDLQSGKQLLLNFDVAGGGSSDDRSLFAWLRKQFAKLGIQLQIRDTQYSRFQEKVRAGQVQLFSWGWTADYPDPENFLFLLYGPNGKAKYGGENAVNYQNPQFDRLFIEMRSLPNGPQRQAVIDRMIDIVRHDTPWIFGFHPQSFVLTQSWVGATKPNDMANNTLKYMSINPELRAQKRLEWNKPIVWPLGVGLLFLLLLLSPLFFSYWKKQHKRNKDN